MGGKLTIYPDTTARTASLVALTSVIKSLPQAMYAANMPAVSNYFVVILSDADGDS